MNNKSRKNKRNTCFPRNSSLTSVPQIYSDSVNDNTDNYFLLINKYLLDCVCFTDKQ
jgi:hypothetical protein